VCIQVQELGWRCADSASNRRFHRRVEEAIAAGVLLPGQGDAGMGPGGNVGAFRRPIGEKPKMWEVWIDPSAGIDKQSSPSGEWSGIQVRFCFFSPQCQSD
jgi:hypothetical protein